MEMARIQSEINRLFDNLLDLEGDAGGAGNWMPNADILETGASDPSRRAAGGRPGATTPFGQQRKRDPAR